MKSNRLKAIVWTIIIVWAIAFSIFMVANFPPWAILKLLVIVVIIAIIGAIYQDLLQHFENIEDRNKQLDAIRKADAECRKAALKSMLVYKGIDPITHTTTHTAYINPNTFPKL